MNELFDTSISRQAHLGALTLNIWVKIRDSPLSESIRVYLYLCYFHEVTACTRVVTENPNIRHYFTNYCMYINTYRIKLNLYGMR